MAKARAKSGKIKDLKARKTITAREAASVKGGGRKAGKGQQDFLIVKMNDVIITSVT